MITVKTTITEEQYEKAHFAIDKKNANHWLILADGTCFFLGRDYDSLKNTERAVGFGDETWDVQAVIVSDENGNEEEVEAWIVPTDEAWNDLDLEAFADGRIEWR